LHQYFKKDQLSPNFLEGFLLESKAGNEDSEVVNARQ
jgi:hypothetical protein